MKLNASKCKEMMISIVQDEDDIPSFVSRTFPLTSYFL